MPGTQNAEALQAICIMPQGAVWQTLAGMFAQQGAPRVNGARVDGPGQLPPDPDLVVVDAVHARDDEILTLIGLGTAPVLVLVGQGDEERGARLVDEGAFDFLVRDALDRRLLGSVVRHAFHQARRGDDERHALALQGAGDGLWDWNVGTGRVYLSARLRAMLGIPDAPPSATLPDWFRRVHRDDVKTLDDALQAHVRGEASRLEVEHRVVHPDGTVRWVLCRGHAVRGAGSQAVRVVGSCTDVTRRRREQEALRRQAMHDALTTLPNRVAFQEHLTSSLAEMHRLGQGAFAVLFIDLDRFKLINDSLGHLVGDELLVQTAERLQRVLRAQDVVARFGGDEFVVLLRDVDDASTAMLAASRVHRALNEPMVLGGQRVFTTASIGMALAEHRYRRAEEMLRDADAAMYQAKALGRGRTVQFHPRVRAEALQKFQFESDLWRGLEQREFRLHYLPIISLKTGTLTGFEALLRWQHPERGLLSPGAFVPDAEAHGLMVRVGEWVLDESCRQLRAWAAQGYPDLTMTVNLSTSQLQSGGMVDTLAEVLGRRGIPSSRLCVDITEGMVASTADDASIGALQTLHAQGVQVCLDDFGRGYSSLTRLAELPISVVKLDPAIVAMTGVGPETNRMVRAVVDLAEAMGVRVLAEGVEKREQLYELLNLDVDGVQGNLFSGPVDVEGAAALLAGNGWMARWQKVQTLVRSTSSPSLPRMA